jgi:hypothetical protein
LHIIPVIGFVQDAVAKMRIFVLALAAQFYDALRDHFSGLDISGVRISTPPPA